MPPAIQQQEEETVLMAASQHITTKSTSSSTTNTSTTNTNTETLARTNKLRLQINELLNESVLHVHPTLDHHHGSIGGGGGGGGRDVVEAKWSNIVRSYISNVSSIIGSLDETLLSPNVALLPNTNNNNSSGGSNVEGGNKYRVPLLSDKFYKSITSQSTSASTNPLTTYTFPFNGGKSLSIIPIGSFANNVGLTSVHGNGNIVPTLDLAVLVTADDKDGDGKKGEGFVGGKDYLNHRYTDVSFSVLFVFALLISVCCGQGLYSKAAHHMLTSSISHNTLSLPFLSLYLFLALPHINTQTSHTTEKEHISNPLSKAIITEETS